MINLKDYFDPVSIERHGLETLAGNAGFPHLSLIHISSLSAGRVQSVAVRLIVEREREIIAFKSESSFRVNGIFMTEKDKSDSNLISCLLYTSRCV